MYLLKIKLPLASTVRYNFLKNSWKSIIVGTQGCLYLTPWNVCATIYQGCRHLPWGPGYCRKFEIFGPPSRLLDFIDIYLATISTYRRFNCLQSKSKIMQRVVEILCGVIEYTYILSTIQQPEFLNISSQIHYKYYNGCLTWLHIK